ncbi:alpha-L-arabinofuranosidase C-terminal domain-containing protein [Paenibacillus sp. MMS20-IR301]|uniref:alpha-L-arabinofuranosidase C-terminal domain-containing protein n=1 Tax=Paenibacillus sp. MMS20-IR301 TaxID=2895946 RepID=UPI0028E2B555|nr:alpha-L-arabinofuranosidase C-terminal domain-containing protein [Paenibacillus sp. MMS20-IR301]WNS43426.1 alpha-L-arabinofuranosidase C-terminal domain-containing protein [Paenibacillus sp. MMS20-IR301]
MAAAFLLISAGALYYGASGKTGDSQTSLMEADSVQDKVTLSATPAPAADSGPAYSLTVDTANPGAEISPMLYGAFFEEINHAGDGGLYAELISNRSFEDSPDTLFNWWVEEQGGSQGNISLISSGLLIDVQKRAMKLDALAAPEGGRVSAVNNGFWGIPVVKDAEYKLSFYAKPEPGKGMPLRITLESADGKQVFAEQVVDEWKEGWNQYTYALTASGTAGNARILFSADQPGAIYLDMVSLFPQTWKDRENGLRIDLAEKVAAMKPSFVRFPGGCFVEGKTPENAYRWKTTIGPLETRPGHAAYWNYRSSDGLGFHEYLQWAEDLQAEPLYVAYIGISHDGDPVTKANTVPLNEIQPWIQDVLDAIEYANGPVTSKWGAERAANGHPEPFNLKYVEIGNENNFQLSEYVQRYGLFYKAIKEKYPEMNLIANTAVEGETIEMIDEHYYESSEWFMSNANRYDTYDRSGPGIYVGEYAVTKGAGEGNLNAALGEAAFMTGMERNSDIVRMSSYAPLFVNTKDRTWNPDAIVFDTSSSFGTPSYHVQQMFGSNKGDVVLPAVLSASGSGEADVKAAIQGGIGLGTWSTQAEYSNVKVTQGDTVLFADDFSTDSGAWTVKSGSWEQADGVFRQTSSDTDIRAVAGDASWSDYTLSLKARKTGGAEGMLIMFGSKDDGTFYWWNLGGWGNTQSAIEKSVGGSRSVIGQTVPISIATGEWYDIRIELSGGNIRTYLNNQLIQEVNDQNSSGPMFTTASRDLATGEIIVKVVNSGDTAHKTKLVLAGLESRKLTGTATVLKSDDPSDQNSFTAPDKVAPVSSEIQWTAGSQEYEFPKYSVTVLRLKEGGA